MLAGCQIRLGSFSAEQTPGGLCKFHLEEHHHTQHCSLIGEQRFFNSNQQESHDQWKPQNLEHQILLLIRMLGLSFFRKQSVACVRGGCHLPAQLATAPKTPSFNASLVQTRGKRTKKQGLLPGAQRVINMLSVFSARKKQPRRLKLCVEDQLRHNTVQKAWQIHMRNKKQEREETLKIQYEKMKEACDELEKLNTFLAFEATKRERGKRFSPEMRVPTETPSNEIWANDWKSTDPYQQKSL